MDGPTETPTAQPPAGGDERPPVNTTPTPQELMRRGAAERDPDPEPDPWDALGDRAREIAEKKGWKSPADMLNAYEAATTRLSQRDEEKEALMEEMAKLEREREQYQPQQTYQQNGQQQPPPAFDFDAMATQLIDPTTGEVNMARAMEVSAAVGAQMAWQAAQEYVNQKFEQFEQERISPLAADREERQMAQQLDELQERYGDETFGAVQERVLERLKSEPDYVDRLGGVRGAFADTLFDIQREESEARERETQAHALRGGGRRPAQGPQEDPELVAMDRQRWRPNDGF